jgi:hypothetical protein
LFFYFRLPRGAVSSWRLHGGFAVAIRPVAAGRSRTTSAAPKARGVNTTGAQAHESSASRRHHGRSRAVLGPTNLTFIDPGIMFGRAFSSTCDHGTLAGLARCGDRWSARSSSSLRETRLGKPGEFVSHRLWRVPDRLVFFMPEGIVGTIQRRRANRAGSPDQSIRHRDSVHVGLLVSRPCAPTRSRVVTGD